MNRPSTAACPALLECITSYLYNKCLCCIIDYVVNIINTATSSPWFTVSPRNGWSITVSHHYRRRNTTVTLTTVTLTQCPHWVTDHRHSQCAHCHRAPSLDPPQNNLPRTIRRCFSLVTGSFFGSSTLRADFLTSPCCFRPNIATWKNYNPRSSRISTDLCVTSFIALRSKCRK